MGLIERWVILVCGECGALVPNRGASLCTHRADAGTGSLVKVVPADAYRGAVEALRDIAQGYEEREGVRYRLDRAQMMALAHRAATRGQ